jgi:hypothetical protein
VLLFIDRLRGLRAPPAQPAGSRGAKALNHDEPPHFAGPVSSSKWFPSGIQDVPFFPFASDSAENFFLNHSRTGSAPLASTAAAMLAVSFALFR